MKSVRIVPVALATLALAMPAIGAPNERTAPPARQKGPGTSSPLLDLSRWLDDRFRATKRTPPVSSEAPPCYEIDRTKCPIG